MLMDPDPQASATKVLGTGRLVASAYRAMPHSLGPVEDAGHERWLIEGWRGSKMGSAHATKEGPVVIRVFRPTIHRGQEAEFESFLRETAVPLVSRQSGIVAQHIGRPRDASSTEYLFVTVWEEVESIRAFAGERWEEAVIAPEEEHLLKDTWIGHYEAMATPDGV